MLRSPFVSLVRLHGAFLVFDGEVRRIVWDWIEQLLQFLVETD